MSAAAVPESTAEQVSAPVKLVIWDLDETLWAGTLSEGPVRLDPSRVDLVRTLNGRGSSMRSARRTTRGRPGAASRQPGLWDEFVFARIDWSPKGPRVARIVEDAQLRPENVLFIDDLPLQPCRGPPFRPRHPDRGARDPRPAAVLPELAGKDDSDRSRLRQYRHAGEEAGRPRVGTTDARGVPALVRHPDRYLLRRRGGADRLFELLSRTHQLNFTKRRLGLEHFEVMLADPDREAGYVPGPRSLRRLRHLRLLLARSRRQGLRTSCSPAGCSAWASSSGCTPTSAGPAPVAGEVSSSLEGERRLDHAGLDGCDDVPGGMGPSPAASAAAQRDRFLMVGGCDLNTTAQFLGGRIATEFAHTGPTARSSTSGHTELLRQSASALTDEQWVVDGSRSPTRRRSVHRFSTPATTCSSTACSPTTPRGSTATGEGSRRALVPVASRCHRSGPSGRRSSRQYGRDGIDREFLMWFAGNSNRSVASHPIDSKRTCAGWRTRSPTGARIVFINGAEIPFDDPREPDRHLRHRHERRAGRVVATLPNASVCDVADSSVTEVTLTDTSATTAADATCGWPRRSGP